jgi:oxaloacetate decarboxylase
MGPKNMHWGDRREKFRGVLEGARCVYPASVYDPMTARLAADLGYEIGMFSGSVASLTILGAPDIVVLTLSEFAAQALRINRAGNLPLMVDADHGYGNALNVKRTVEELETVGVCGLSIEDTVLPPVFGSAEKPQVLSIEEGVGKMRAALAGRQDKRLVIVGRSSSIGITGLADTIARAKAYEAAGVDAFFMAGAKTRSEVEAVVGAIRIPLVLARRRPSCRIWTISAPNACASASKAICRSRPRFAPLMRR